MFFSINLISYKTQLLHTLLTMQASLHSYLIYNIKWFTFAGNTIDWIHSLQKIQLKYQLLTLLPIQLFTTRETFSYLRYFQFVKKIHYIAYRAIHRRLCQPIKNQAPSTKRNLKTPLYSTVRLTIRANPSKKRSSSKALFKPEEFGNTGFAF